MQQMMNPSYQGVMYKMGEKSRVVQLEQLKNVEKEM